MIPIYICAASAEMDRAEAFAAACEAAGGSVTHRWWDAMRASDVPEEELLVGEQVRSALDDVGGVLRAEIVFVLVPSRGVRTRGLYVELGIAIGLRSTASARRTLTVDAPDGTTWQSLGVFGSLAAHLPTESDALAWLADYAARAA
jgi:hypothetical protein